VAAEGVPPSDKSFANHTSANAIFALMSRFNSAVPMDDSPRGFFGILNEFFDQLAAEEAAACQWAGITPTEYPPFGKSTDDYNTVAKRFYNVWSSFSTKKSFSWRDKYRLSDAPDRRIRRLMEKENKKFREEGIREYNDAVISLVAFVKKRDPRYVPNTQSEAERQQMLRNSAAAQAARQRAANQEKLAEFVLPEWAQSRNDEDNQHYDEYSMSEEEDEVEEIECVVCNKSFKSEKQFEAHEKSKKHIKAVQQLKRQMRKENAHLELDEEEPGPSPSIQTPQEVEDEDNQEPEATAGSTKTKEGEEVKPSTEKPPQSPQQQDESESSFEDEYAPRSVVEERILNGPGKKKKPSKPGEDIAESAADGLDDLTLDDDTKPAEGGDKKIGKAKLKREKKAARQAAAEAEAAGASVSSLLHIPTSLLHFLPLHRN
jgi:DnaJ family protein A protein 5